VRALCCVVLEKCRDEGGGDPMQSTHLRLPFPVSLACSAGCAPQENLVTPRAVGGVQSCRGCRGALEIQKAWPVMVPSGNEEAASCSPLTCALHTSHLRQGCLAASMLRAAGAPAPPNPTSELPQWPSLMVPPKPPLPLCATPLTRPAARLPPPAKPLGLARTVCG